MAEVLEEPGRVGTAAARSFDYLDLYRASPADRVRFIRAGVAAKTVKRLVVELRVEQRTMFHALNLKTATINKKAARNEALSIEDGERVIGLAKLLGQLEAMLEEAGVTDEFDAATWLSRWLSEPLPAFGGGKPMEMLDTMEGQALVAQALGQIESGAYA